MNLNVNVDEKLIVPSVINLEQYSTSDTLVFELDKLSFGQIDLSICTAFVVTQFGDVTDETECEMNGNLITWNVTAYTTKQNGTLTYQLRLVENGITQWYSKKAICLINSSIEADDYIAAMYPSILIQWKNRMDELILEGVDVDYLKQLVDTELSAYLTEAQTNALLATLEASLKTYADSKASTVQSALDLHLQDKSNPHEVTLEQLNAYSKNEVNAYVDKKISDASANYDPEGSADTVEESLNLHKTDTTNPHSVTAEQTGAYTKEAVNQLILDTKALITTLEGVSQKQAINVGGYTTVEGAIAGLSTKLQTLLGGIDNLDLDTIKELADAVTALKNNTYNKTETYTKSEVEACAEAKANAVQDALNKHIEVQKEVTLASAFDTRTTASDSTNSKYEIKDKSIAKVKALSGRSLKSINLCTNLEFKNIDISSITSNLFIRLWVYPYVTQVASTNLSKASINSKGSITCSFYNSTEQDINCQIGYDATGHSFKFHALVGYYSASIQYEVVNGYISMTNGMIKQTSEIVNDLPYVPYFEGIKNAQTTAIKSYDEDNNVVDTLSIPTEIQALEGYGWGLSDTDKSLNNYIDFDNKKFVQNVGMYTFTGNEVWQKSVDNKFYMSNANTYLVNSYMLKDVANTLCNLTGLNYQYFRDNNIAMSYTVQGDPLVYRIWINYDVTKTTEEFKTWLATANITFYYPLATPIETDISQYLNDDNYLAYNLGTETLVGTEIPALAEITYNADLNSQVVENADNIAKLNVDIQNAKNESAESAKAYADEKKTEAIASANTYADEKVNEINSKDIFTYQNELTKIAKGQANLLPNDAIVAQTGTIVDTEIYFEAGTYTCSLEGSYEDNTSWRLTIGDSYIDKTLPSPITITISESGTYNVSIVANTTTVSSVMLNEGNVALPYQTYKGEIIHQSELLEYLALYGEKPAISSIGFDSASYVLVWKNSSLNYSSGLISSFNISKYYKAQINIYPTKAIDSVASFNIVGVSGDTSYVSFAPVDISSNNNYVEANAYNISSDLISGYSNSNTSYSISRTATYKIVITDIYGNEFNQEFTIQFKTSK